jgi:hypothetical protein
MVNDCNGQRGDTRKRLMSANFAMMADGDEMAMALQSIHELCSNGEQYHNSHNTTERP